jgi:hypothetical protein
MQMKRLLALTLLVFVGATAEVAAAANPIVPTFIQNAIARKSPLLPYVPARIATGFRYESYMAAREAVRINFRNKAGSQIVFVANAMTEPCRAGMQKSFQLDGNKVYWRQTPTEQRAWRCVLGPRGRQVRLLAATNEPPTRFADVGLGIIAASGHRVR